MKSHWFRRLFVNMDKVDDSVAMGSPEGTIVTLVEDYMMMHTSGFSDEEIFGQMEDFRVPKGTAPRNVDFSGYINYRVRLEHGTGGGISDNEIMRAIGTTADFIKQFGDWVEDAVENQPKPNTMFTVALPHPDQNRPASRYTLRDLRIDYYEHPKTIGEVVTGIKPLYAYPQMAIVSRQNVPIAIVSIEKSIGDTMICMTRLDGSRTNFGAYARGTRQEFFEAVNSIVHDF
jgi:hypothetical protein